MPNLPHSFFSTDSLPLEDRLASWNEDISVIFDHEPAPIDDPSPFRAVFDLYYFGNSVVAGLDASAGRYVRSPRKATRDGMDSILIQLFLEGGVQFGVGQRTTYSATGDIVIFDLAQPVDNINTRFRHITMVWPRPAIEAVVPNISSWHGLKLPSESPAVRLLKQHMISSHQLAPSFSVQEGLRVEEAALAIAGAAMLEKDSMPDSPPPCAMAEALTYQIKRYIRQNLESSDQSPDCIARHFGISRRQLYHLLEPIGGVARYQRHLRLQRCLVDLQNPDRVQDQISEIAYRWGFKNMGTFNRNFRATYGFSPGEGRNRKFETSPPLPSFSVNQHNAEVLKSEHQQWFISLGI